MIPLSYILATLFSQKAQAHWSRAIYSHQKVLREKDPSKMDLHKKSATDSGNLFIKVAAGEVPLPFRPISSKSLAKADQAGR